MTARRLPTETLIFVLFTRYCLEKTLVDSGSMRIVDAKAEKHSPGSMQIAASPVPKSGTFICLNMNLYLLFHSWQTIVLLFLSSVGKSVLAADGSMPILEAKAGELSSFETNVMLCRQVVTSCRCISLQHRENCC